MSPDERKQLWQQRIESYRSSGESSVKAWCKQNQVGHQSMYKWMKRLELETTETSRTSPQWLTVEVSHPLDEKNSPLIVNIGEFSIEVKEGFNPLLFNEMVQVLKTHVK